MYHEMNVSPKVVQHSQSNSGWVNSSLDHLSYTIAVELQRLNGNTLASVAVTDYNRGAVSALWSRSAEKKKKISNETLALNEDQGNKLSYCGEVHNVCIQFGVTLQ